MPERYPPLDREAARREPVLIDWWRAKLRRSYLTVSASDDVAALEEFEKQARDDREWADGYERGRADAARKATGAALDGPGVMVESRDGWSPSATRSHAYELGLSDG